MDKATIVKLFKEHDCDIEKHDFFNLKVVLFANGNQFFNDFYDHNNRILKIDLDKGYIRIRDNFQGLFLETDTDLDQVQGFSFLSKDQSYRMFPKNDKEKEAYEKEYDKLITEDIAREKSEG